MGGGLSNRAGSACFADIKGEQGRLVAGERRQAEKGGAGKEKHTPAGGGENVYEKERQGNVKWKKYLFLPLLPGWKKLHWIERIAFLAEFLIGRWHSPALFRAERFSANIC